MHDHEVTLAQGNILKSPRHCDCTTVTSSLLLLIILSRLMFGHSWWSLVTGASQTLPGAPDTGPWAHDTCYFLSLTDGVEQSGAGGLDHHVRVEEDCLEQRLREGGQLGDQRGEAEVDAESIVRKVAYPEH